MMLHSSEARRSAFSIPMIASGFSIRILSAICSISSSRCATTSVTSPGRSESSFGKVAMITVFPRPVASDTS